MKSANDRATELYDKIKDTRNKPQNTTAVAYTNQDKSLVGTSDRYLRKEVRESLDESEEEVPSIRGKSCRRKHYCRGR